MKSIILSLSLSLSLSSIASGSGSLQLSSKIGVNIDYRVDENNNIRIISNGPYKKSVKPYVFKSRSIASTENSSERYEVLEIAAN